MKVTQMIGRSGNAIANQFIVTMPKGTMFQSYDSNIAFLGHDGTVTLGGDWDYSKTTGKYRNQFLGETKKETQAKLDSGEYILDLEL